MKKRLLILPLFIILLVVIISAPSYDSNDYRKGDLTYTLENNVETTRTFLIKQDNGQEYYRTFEDFNKARVNRGTRHVSRNQRGIYRDFFDVDKRLKDEYCDTDCPPGWKCKKE